MYISYQYKRTLYSSYTILFLEQYLLRKLPMQNFIRLAYISRAAETEIEHIKEVNEQILSTARLYNKKNGITGILCFDNNCYYQCLEGAKEAVEQLYSKILHDRRHTDVKIVINEPITSLSFAGWDMKHAANVEWMIPLIRLHGHKNFSPYDFAENLFKDLLDFLSQRCAAGKC
jgi:Sensors of blue-light using FAD